MSPSKSGILTSVAEVESEGSQNKTETDPSWANYLGLSNQKPTDRKISMIVKSYMELKSLLDNVENSEKSYGSLNGSAPTSVTTFRHKRKIIDSSLSPGDLSSLGNRKSQDGSHCSFDGQAGQAVLDVCSAFGVNY
jgi:hypothetical protein